MRRSIKPLVLSLVAVFVISAAVAGILIVSQIIPDIRNGRPGGSNAVAYDEQWSADFPEGYDLKIDVSGVAVDIRAHDGARLEARFEGTRAPDANGELPFIEFLEQGREIRIRERHSSEKALFNITIWNGGHVRGTLTVLVPRTHMGQFSADAFSGSISASGLDADQITISTGGGNISAAELSAQGDLTITAFSGQQTLERLAGQNISLETSSGGITAKSIQARSLEANLFSGSLKITGAEIEGESNLSTSSGNIALTEFNAESLSADQFSGKLDLNDVRVRGRASLTTSSGNITGENAAIHDLDFNTFSGRVNLRDLTCDRIDGETSSGEVSLALLGGANAKIKTFSGHVGLSMPQGTGFEYDFDTFSGNTEVAFAGESRTGKQASGKIGDGTYDIAIETSSGNISIRANP